MKKRTNLNRCLLISLFLLGISCATAAGEVIYVDPNATGTGNGSTWTDACNYLQDALAAAQYGDEIWVVQGIYTPDCNSLVPEGTGNRAASFQLVNGASLYGGFPTGGGNWQDRDHNNKRNHPQRRSARKR